MRVTITYLGVELDVEGNYEPEEPSKLSGPPEDCHEGEPSYFEVEDIFVGDVSIYEMMQCLAVATNTSPISHVDVINDIATSPISHTDVIHDIAALVCEACDNMEPDYDEAE